jgi:hypothetical protein
MGVSPLRSAVRGHYVKDSFCAPRTAATNFKIDIDMIQQKPESANIEKSGLAQQEKII